MGVETERVLEVEEEEAEELKKKKQEEQRLGWKAYVSLLCLVLQNASLVMTTRYATGMKKEVSFIPSSVVISTEVAKLIISLGLVQYTEQRGAFAIVTEEARNHPASCLQCVIPASCYTLASIFIYLALANLEVTLFQVCNQSKVLITAGWSMLLLDRRFSRMKWFALVLLAAGIVVCSLQGAGNKKADASKRVQYPVFGLICVFVSAAGTSFGGVYFERLLKKDPRAKDVSLWVRNVFLSLGSMAFGVGSLIVSEGTRIDFFRGYDRLTLVIIALQAAGGIIVAMCVKHADNVLKGFATAFSILLCAFLSYLLYGFQPSPSFGAGVALVTSATLLYSRREA